jgi:drug/metabolite transporter (DMT)-like permease
LHFKFLTKYIGHWIIGTILTFFGAFLGFFAISVSAVSIIQPLIGLGPIILAILLTLVFKEKISKKLWLAIIVSAVGVIFLAFSSVPVYQYLTFEFYEQQLLFISVIMVGIVVLFGYILHFVQNIQLGVPEGIIGGLLGGLPSLYAKVAVPKFTELSLHWSIVALIGTQFLAFLFLQRGIHKGKLTIVSSVFMTFSIIVPIAVAFLWLAEQITWIQIIGIILILTGAIYFIYNNPSKENVPYPIAAYPSPKNLVSDTSDEQETSFI